MSEAARCRMWKKAIRSCKCAVRQSMYAVAFSVLQGLLVQTPRLFFFSCFRNWLSRILICDVFSVTFNGYCSIPFHGCTLVIYFEHVAVDTGRAILIMDPSLAKLQIDGYSALCRCCPIHFLICRSDLPLTPHVKHGPPTDCLFPHSTPWNF